MLLRVCPIDSVLDDELIEVSIDGMEVPVMLVRVDGEILATTSICPHEVVSLTDGSLDARLVTCHGHGYEFDLATGACSHDPTLRLRTYRVVMKDDEVWIDLMRTRQA